MQISGCLVFFAVLYFAHCHLFDLGSSGIPNNALLGLTLVQSRRDVLPENTPKLRQRDIPILGSNEPASSRIPASKSTVAQRAQLFSGEPSSPHKHPSSPREGTVPAATDARIRRFCSANITPHYKVVYGEATILQRCRDKIRALEPLHGAGPLRALWNERHPDPFADGRINKGHLLDGLMTHLAQSYVLEFHGRLAWTVKGAVASERGR